MKNQEPLDSYSEDLMRAFGQPTGTASAGLMGGSISPDQIQRLLPKARWGSAQQRSIRSTHENLTSTV